jgi:anti-anti-sigma factor
MHDQPTTEVVHPRAGAAVAIFLGEQDLETADDVRALLLSLLGENELVVADFSKTEFVDSSIIHAVYTSHSVALQHGRTFRLQLSTAPIVHKAFEISGVLKTVPCASTREEALSPVPATDGAARGHRKD